MLENYRNVRRLSASSCLIFMLMFLQACTSKLAYLGQAVHSSTQSGTVVVGNEAFDLYSIQTGDLPSGETATVFYIGGSGCTSLSVYLAPYFAGADAGLTVFGLDKSGVEKGDLGLSCSPEFWQSYTYDEILRRNLLALDIVRQQNPNNTVTLVGTSEGGPIALEMAMLAPDIAKVAVIGAGGMSQRKELEFLAEQRGVLDDFQRIAARIDANPDSLDAFEMGYPHAYWSAVFDRDPATFLERLTVPVLIIIGANDENVPFASARLANSMLPNAKMIEWPDADHVFNTPSGDQRPLVLQRVSRFLLD